MIPFFEPPKTLEQLSEATVCCYSLACLPQLEAGPWTPLQLRPDGHVVIGYGVKRVSHHQTSLMVIHSLREAHW